MTRTGHGKSRGERIGAAPPRPSPPPTCARGRDRDLLIVLLVQEGDGSSRNLTVPAYHLQPSAGAGRDERGRGGHGQK